MLETAVFGIPSDKWGETPLSTVKSIVKERFRHWLSLVSAWGVIGWLAVVNTAFAFILWNSSLQILSAVESSIINNMMLVQIAVLAWLFLGEQPTARGMVGLAFAIVGVLLVNLKKG